MDTTSTNKGTATLVGQADQVVQSQSGQLQNGENEYPNVLIDKTASCNVNQ